jgi:PhnB protein
MAEQPPPAPIEVYLTVRGGDEAVAFYEKAFGAVEAFRQHADDGTGRLLHATLDVFGAQIMLSDEFPEHSSDTAAPPTRGGASVTIHVNRPSAADVDAILARAQAAGATITMPAAAQFWGAYYARLVDPFGHAWSFGAPAG